jgi:hypothetical protein
MRDVRIFPSRQWPRPNLNPDGVVLRMTCWCLRNIARLPKAVCLEAWSGCSGPRIAYDSRVRLSHVRSPLSDRYLRNRVL